MECSGEVRYAARRERSIRGPKSYFASGHNMEFVEWAPGAVPGSTPGRFPGAPHRTRRAPFVAHRALRRRCHEGRGLLPGQAEGTDLRRRLLHQPDLTVAPTIRPSTRLAPAVALVDVPHAGPG